MGEEIVETSAARFKEWPFGNAVFKRIILNGVPTFQLQFTWDPYTEQPKALYSGEPQLPSPAKRHRSIRQKSPRSTKSRDTIANPKATLRKARYTPEINTKIRQLKKRGLSWHVIAKQFPGRSPRAVKVRYHTKLKTNPSPGAPQLCDEPRIPLVVDDPGEEEWEVEEICSHRKSEDGSLEFLVKWKGGEETWEPLQNVAETEALDRYEHLSSLVVGSSAAVGHTCPASFCRDVWNFEAGVFADTFVVRLGLCKLLILFRHSCHSSLTPHRDLTPCSSAGCPKSFKEAVATPYNFRDSRVQCF